MSIADNYQIIQVTSADANIRVDVTWEYDDLNDLYIWQQDQATGAVTYFNLGDFTVVEKSDGTGDYIEVQNVSTGTAIVNTGRATPKAQTYDLANSEAIDPVALIKALDQAVKMIQETSEITGTPDRRVITSVNPFDIPDKVSRAGKLLSFDENGDVQFTTSDEALDKAIGYAEEWANNPEDQLVSAGAGGDQVDDYSALHHSAKASAQRVLAETARTGAETAETNAQTAETNAQTAQSNAETAESNAQGHESKAQQWAEEAEDVEVETGKYSAKHWALKAISGVLLHDEDLAGKSNADVTWNSSWDSYDYVHLVVVGAVSSTATQIAFALSSDAGTSWENFLGSTDEAISWTSSGVSSNKRFDGRFEMNLKSTLKVPYAQHFASDFLVPTASTGFSQGITLNYDGSFLSGSTSPDKWRGWDTGTSGLNGYTLRFVGESANFTSGKFKIIGYNYP